MTTNLKEAGTGTIDIARQPITRRLRPNVSPATAKDLEDAIKAIVFPIPTQEVLRLSPSRPSIGQNHLTLYSPALVSADPDQEYALFSSQFPGIVFPGLQVEFMPIKTGKSHLVEFHVQLFSNITYKFRKFTYPSGDYEDMSDNSTDIISVLVPAAPNWSYDYGVEIQQRNDPDENAGWMLKYVRITALD